MQEIPTKPYLVRALFEWCNDCGYTPYVTVAVGENVQVPFEYVKNGEIVLNISPLATNRLAIGNDVLQFQARFGGVARDVRVPVEFIRAIYARETGQGMAFEGPVPQPGIAADEAARAGETAPDSSAAPTVVPIAGTVTPLRTLATVETGGPPQDPPAGPGPSGERPRLTRIK